MTTAYAGAQRRARDAQRSQSLTTPRTTPPLTTPPLTTPQRPRLAVVPDRPRAARTPFVLLVVGLLAGGLIVLLVLNTKLAENAFRVQNLQRESAKLADQEQALRQEVAVIESPQHLAELARRHGMVLKENPAFLDTRSGKVLGEPKPGGAPSGAPGGAAVKPPARR